MTSRALAALGLALTLAGCADGTPQLYVTGLCGLPDDLAACKAPAGVCDTFLNGSPYTYAQVNSSAGLYANDLFQVAEVKNQAPTNADTDIGRVATMDAIIESARIEYAGGGLAVSDAAVPMVFTPVPFNGTATIFLPIMNSATVAEVAAQIPAGSTASVTAHIKLHGHFADGHVFEVAPFDVPARVINAVFDATVPCADPTQVKKFCYAAGQTGGEVCVTP